METRCASVRTERREVAETLMVGVVRIVSIGYDTEKTSLLLVLIQEVNMRIYLAKYFFTSHPTVILRSTVIYFRPKLYRYLFTNKIITTMSHVCCINL